MEANGNKTRGNQVGCAALSPGWGIPKFEEKSSLDSEGGKDLRKRYGRAQGRPEEGRIKTSIYPSEAIFVIKCINRDGAIVVRCDKMRLLTATVPTRYRRGCKQFEATCACAFAKSLTAI
ncbi:hypothetical protein LIA77_10280 [Sarocladium implicatum]|nr:hypothetical protein LIA77_10280 [Sarocladium implicatum]